MSTTDGSATSFDSDYAEDVAAISAHQASIAVIVFDEESLEVIYHNQQWLMNNRPYLADQSKSSYVGDNIINIYSINERAQIRHIIEKGVAELKRKSRVSFVAFGWDADQFQSTAWRDRNFDMHFKRLDVGGAAKWVAYYGIEHFDTETLPAFEPSKDKHTSSDEPMKPLDFSITKAERNVSLVELFILFGAYVAAFGLVWAFIRPLQITIFPSLTILSLVFIPHGIRVLGTWLYREKAIVPLVLAELIFVVAMTSRELSAQMLTEELISAIIGGSCAYLVIVLFELSNIRLDFRTHSIRLWRPLVLVGIFASVINSLGKSVVFSHQILPKDGLVTIAGYIAGDVVGLVICLLLLILISRKLHVSQ